jgi:hypothetical protein
VRHAEKDNSHDRRKSSGAKSPGDLYWKSSTRKPWPRGLNATKATPSSLQASIKLFVSCNAQKESTPLGRRLSWQLPIADRVSVSDGTGIWIRVGILLELALWSVFAEHSESPMYLVLPAFLISSRAVIGSLRGVAVGVRLTALMVTSAKSTYWDPSGGGNIDPERIRASQSCLRCTL